MLRIAASPTEFDQAEKKGNFKGQVFGTTEEIQNNMIFDAEITSHDERAWDGRRFKATLKCLPVLGSEYHLFQVVTIL